MTTIAQGLLAPLLKLGWLRSLYEFHAYHGVWAPGVRLLRRWSIRAKVMLLIVNVWLGFPYMMVLCSGLIKSIPADLYEASAVAGAGPWVNFRRITMPLILKPLTPLLISAFAFNFNNFVLISLLTAGGPDRIDTAQPVGSTDILVSYTWRIAFQDSGQQFGLAAAISTVIFAIVAAITLVQMRFTRITDEPRR